ncbi:hypothetical protein AADZ90_017510 [Aestuariibius sp. 2305UL40-4]|uniref:hypothetical protein n=1 Tax=Aestuariibius violaceus TaxID=3234132 RepID=UPI00345F0622
MPNITCISGSKVIAGAALALGLAACEPQPAVVGSQEQGIFLATMAAEEMRPEVGTEIADGLTLNAVTAQQNTLAMELGLDLAVGSMGAGLRSNIASEAQRAFAEGFCEDPDTQLFFDYGALMRVRIVGNDRAVLNDFVMNSCGR